MEKTDILIIGAGAAGMMAAFKLSQKGKKVTVLEARDRTGGRIHTIKDRDFFKQAELGAEFIHGDLPVTLALLKEANIAIETATGKMARHTNGNFTDDQTFIEHWDLLVEKLQKLQKDETIGQFLNREFGDDKYQGMRKSVTRYVSGYDTADIYKASAFALREEWLNEDDGAQHRVTDGYCAMIDYLSTKTKESGGQIFLNSIAKIIHWEKGYVHVTTADGVKYSADKLIAAMPLGVLQAHKHEKGALVFEPPVPSYQNAINQFGFGAIIKFLLEFDAPFWEEDKVTQASGKNLKDVTFLISDQEIPTWWMQHSPTSGLLTGWLGGLPAEAKKNCTAEELLQQSLRSLENIFKISEAELRSKLIAWKIVNWTTDPFTRGSYVYDMVETPEARKLLMQSMEETIYFAGEYLYEGPSMGTVEAALTSGVEVAERIN
jgi:monoamine oxidase